MNIFGGLERALGDHLYVYRVPVAIIVLLLVAGTGIAAYRRGWYRALWRRRLVAGIIAVPLLAVTLPAGYYTLSPLWRQTYLQEASPLAAVSNASVASTPPPVAASATTVSPESRTTPAAETTAAPAAALMAMAPNPAPAMPPVFTARVSHTGQFVGADEFHFGRGQARIIETSPGRYLLRFEEFAVRNGPDLYAYLSLSATGYSADALNLGRLKATAGDFNYEIPEGVDIAGLRSVVVWCRRFGVLFATAPLRPA